MRARLYEIMAQFEDPYGFLPHWTLPGNAPDRYLARGKHLNS
jgi:hypothetical protein